MSKPACAGEWALFDSTEWGDHVLARAICLTCPLVEECMRAVVTVEQPTGTWAGALYTGTTKRTGRKIA